MNETFWQRCHDAGCAVVPILVYAEDNVDSTQLKYVCAEIVVVVYLTEICLGLGDDNVYSIADTPEQALRNYISRHER